MVLIVGHLLEQPGPCLAMIKCRFFAGFNPDGLSGPLCLKPGFDNLSFHDRGVPALNEDDPDDREE